jgi:replicative DNA helicase
MSDEPRTPQNNFDAPFDEQMERALIGSVLINPSVFLSLASFLHPDDFFMLRHQYIWEALLRISSHGEPIERQTLRRELEAYDLFETVGGDVYISELINSTSSAMYAEQFGRLIERDAVRRRLLEAADSIKDIARDRQRSLEEVIGDAEATLFRISERRTQRDVVTMREAASQYFEQIEQMMQRADRGLGLPSGFKKLDALLGGLQKKRSNYLCRTPRHG